MPLVLVFDVMDEAGTENGRNGAGEEDGAEDDRPGNADVALGLTALEEEDPEPAQGVFRDPVGALDEPTPLPPPSGGNLSTLFAFTAAKEPGTREPEGPAALGVRAPEPELAACATRSHTLLVEEPPRL